MKYTLPWIVLASGLAVAAGCDGRDLPRGAPAEDVSVITQALSPATMPAPLAYWRFDDCVAGKTTLNDSGGSDYKASIGTGLTCSSTGKVFRAGSFNGT